MPQHTLDKVSIDGFRGLRNLSLDGLGLINILVGQNNSGKTSVLEAMSILCEPFNPYEWLSMVHRRDFGGLDESRVQSLRWSFQQHGELTDSEAMFEGACQMGCSGSFPLRKLHAQYKDLLGEPDPNELKRAVNVRRFSGERAKSAFEKGWRGAEITHFIQADPPPSQPTLFNDPNAAAIEPVSIQIWEGLPTHRRYVPERLRIESKTLTPYSYQINRLQVQNLTEDLLSVGRRAFTLNLAQQFDPQIEDIKIASIYGERPAIYLKHRKLGPAPLSIFGDALRRAVLLASTIPTVSDGVLMIDEIETGIHIKALERVFAWLTNLARQMNVQIFATTHSLEAVDAMLASVGDQIGDVVTYHLEQEQEQTLAKRIPGDVLKRLRFDRGIDVR